MSDPTYSSRATVSLYGFDPELPPGRLNFDRVLFLDFDGVLHPDGCGPDMEFCFNSQFCDVLREADPRGELPIVVSSMWRFTQTIRQLRANFPADIGRQIVGVTRDLLEPDGSPQGAWEMRGSLPSKVGSRQREVLAWMREFSPVGQWLAIDDRPSYFADGCQNLFVVPGLYEDEGGGLSDRVAGEFLVRLKEFLQERPSLSDRP